MQKGGIKIFLNIIMSFFKNIGILAFGYTPSIFDSL